MASTGLIQRAAEFFGSAMARLPAGITFPKRSVVIQTTASNITTWSVDRVKTALDAHERGDFGLSATLVESMGRDDRISGCLNVRLNALCSVNGIDFSIVPSETGQEKLAETVESWWFDVVPDATVRQLLGDVVMMGFALARKHWVLTNRSWNVERLERWHPGNVRWDEPTKRYVAQSETGEVAIDPDDPEWLLITPAGERAWMAGAVRALGMPHVMRAWNWRDWMRFNERHGLPIIVVKEPPNFEDSSKDRFYESLKRMGSSGIVRLPQGSDGNGFDLEFREAKDAAHDTFQKFRVDLDVSIAVYLLGQNLTTEVQGGSFAAATAHARVAGFMLAADAESLSGPLRSQLIVPWCLFNVPNLDVQDCPWPQWDTETPEDLGSSAKTLETFGKAVRGLQDSGLPVDAIELAARFNVPLLENAPMGQPYRQAPNNVGQVPEDSDDTPKALMSRFGMPFAAASGFVDGQTWVDDLTDDARAKAAESIEPFIASLKRVIAKSKDYPELRANVLKAYQGKASPERLREVLQMALILGELAGRNSARQDSK